MSEINSGAEVFEYKATALDVVDGDTFDVTVVLRDEDVVLRDQIVDLGFRIYVHDYEVVHYHDTTEMRVRLYGVDTPEEGDPGYTEAKDALRALVMGFDLTISTAKPHEKYGRWLAQVRTPMCADVSDFLIANGFGVPYFGGPKQPPKE